MVSVIQILDAIYLAVNVLILPIAMKKHIFIVQVVILDMVYFL